MRTFAALCLASLLAPTVACGAAPDNAIEDAPAAPISSGTPTFGGDAGGGSFGNGNVDAGGGPSTQCAKSTAKPQPIPVQLVFIFDRSDSMSGTKWNGCSQGLNAFFSNPASSGIEASLQFFPSPTSANTCSDAFYAAPAVTMRALPNTTDFSAAISGAKLVSGTPTLPALNGSLQYAQKQALLSPGSKTAIVLVTDGQPNACNSTITAVDNAAANANKAGIPVFVVGIGNTGNLDSIAKAGGTNAATIVNANNIQQTEADFQKALDAIRGATLSCEYKIPQLPQGTSVNQVNVEYTPGGGAATTLTYDAACTGTVPGWHYDDPKNPTKIQLCKSTCDTVQKDKQGAIDLVFGCATQGGIPN